MTNATLLLQSLSLSLDTTPAVIDDNDGSGVAWAGGELTLTTAEPSYEDDPEQRELSFPVDADELTELHRILTAHLTGAKYGNELATDGGWVIIDGDRVQAGIEADAVEVRMSSSQMRAWHTKLTLTLLAAAL